MPHLTENKGLSTKLTCTNVCLYSGRKTDAKKSVIKPKN